MTPGQVWPVEERRNRQAKRPAGRPAHWHAARTTHRLLTKSALRRQTANQEPNERVDRTSRRANRPILIEVDPHPVRLRRSRTPKAAK